MARKTQCLLRLALNQAWTSIYLKHLSISNIPLSRTSLYLKHFSFSNISLSQTSLDLEHLFYLKHPSILKIPLSQTSFCHKQPFISNISKIPLSWTLPISDITLSQASLLSQTSLRSLFLEHIISVPKSFSNLWSFTSDIKFFLNSNNSNEKQWSSLVPCKFERVA